MDQNFDAIVAGVVSSVLVLAGQTTAIASGRSVADFVSRRTAARRLWRFKRPDTIYIVSGSVQSLTSAAGTNASGTAFLSGPDAEAVSVVRLSLELLYPRAKVVHAYAPSFPTDSYDGNIIAIGGPVNNSCARDFLADIASTVRFDGLDLVTPNVRYVIATGTPGSTDFGLLVNRENPFDPARRWIVVAGCDSGGVLAAARSLAPSRRMRQTQKKIALGWPAWKSGGARYAVVKTLTTGNIASVPDCIESADIP